MFLNEFIVFHCTIEGGSLLHSLTTSLVKKNLVQSSWTCLHLSFTPLFLVRDVLSIENILLASTFVNPLRILKHSIIFPLSRRFLRENKFSRASLSSYGLLRKDVPNHLCCPSLDTLQFRYILCMVRRPKLHCIF